ncbi:hypothetical protein C475_20827 [Halosimplex carlsbadense 2-9-1]|uniref:Uncharacterized protein n=1 Tax=Halosimplex carlsbadense 2-9-1 TaxID=797114 RepID=M0CD15_9EURY|nr:hypothetical protein [Halosimplex carlsbadense]ELZ20257.1 hypothetical protein C475_20827 [Halosimplex carlsbadense 2-9-1]
MTLGQAIGTGPTAAVGSFGGFDAVVAHAGTTHAGTPHWLLGALAILGIVAGAGGLQVLRDGTRSDRFGAGLLSAGAILVIAGTIGLVEIQIAPEATPDWTRLFPVVNAVSAIVVALGSLVVVRWKWPERPRYVGLGLLLSAWIAYPTLLPQEGLTNPLGYCLAAAVPAAVIYVFYRDAGAAFPGVLTARIPALTAVVTFGMFGVFYLFSAGTLSVNPDLTADMVGQGFVTPYQVASPLVYWPALEFYFPSIPLSGYVSLGSLLLVGILGGLVASNAALAARQLTTGGSVDSPRAVIGTITTAGATACGCCAPAVYGAAGAVFGAAATPVYWAFMDPSSPVGGLFFAASVLILTGSAVRASHDPACAIPAVDRPSGEPSAGD